jgi:hypothetical protein
MTAVSQFDSLMSEISVYVPKPQRKAAYTRLGKALFVALDGAQPDKVDSAFAPVCTFIAKSSIQHARFEYVLAFLASFAVLGGTILLSARAFRLDTITGALLWAAVAGIGGSAMSVLHRSNTLALDPKAGRLFLILQGACRPLLGALFAGFMVLACRAELILAFAKDHPLALIPLATVAGFSERFVPEIMSQLEHTP